MRARLADLADRAIDKAEQTTEQKAPDFADFAVPAVFALVAEKLDAAGRKDAVRTLPHLLYRAGETGSDFLLECVESAAGSLGADIVEPVLELLTKHGRESLAC